MPGGAADSRRYGGTQPAVRSGLVASGAVRSGAVLAGAVVVPAVVWGAAWPGERGRAA